jgi:hydrogenase/urease accessory protein HupE
MRFRLPLLALVTGRRLSADWVIMEAFVLIPAVGTLVAWGMTFLPVEQWIGRAVASVVGLSLIAAYGAELRHRNL